MSLPVAPLVLSGEDRAELERLALPGSRTPPPRPGRKKAGLVLSGAERGQLERWARRGKTSQVLALRAKIVLACAGGRENKAVAAELRTTEHNVARWRGRFIAGAGRAGRREAPPAGRRPSC